MLRILRTAAMAGTIQIAGMRLEDNRRPLILHKRLKYGYT